eukprot:CAMPEP_0119004780 /NCGR_PEP_ID=MMETSP1176-20130426/1349_1 /TAXON_ID=265551 /ORGANISM="Synedropsis recta cf, Strain CCMP1620" /LENGTH=654 /DNA_ID=CAMNT_0006956525 /DNA_START=113 /DNA_END=2073 /DNA_ORIENTATION=+
MSGDDDNNKETPPPKAEEDANDKKPKGLEEEESSPSPISSEANTTSIVLQMGPMYEAIARTESSESQPGAFSIPGIELRRQPHISSEMRRIEEVLVHATVVDCNDEENDDDEQPSLVFEALPLVLRRNGTWKWITAVSLLVLALTFAVALITIQSSNSRDRLRGSDSTSSIPDQGDKALPILDIIPSADPSSAPTREPAPKTHAPTAAPSLRKSMKPSESFSPSQPPSYVASSSPSSAPSASSSAMPSSPPSIYVPQWTTVGSSIVGEYGGDSIGQSIALSQFGNFLAVGAHLYDFDLELDSGMVRVYQLMEARIETGNESWQQIGQDLIGTAAGDQAGWAIDLSADGSIVAIASFTGGENLEGAVRVYEYNRSFNFWDRLGQDLLGGDDAVFFGASICLSDDGLTMVVGADKDSGNGENAGRVQVFRYNRLIGKWFQKGQTFYGDDPEDHAGTVVSLSGDGAVVAIGVPNKDTEGATNAGLVRIYRLHSTGLAWTSVGSELIGAVDEQQFGLSADLSEDGMTLAVSSRNRVHIYHFDPDASDWVSSEIHVSLEEDAFDDSSADGIYVDLSPDGTMIGVSISSGSSMGFVQAYELDDSTGQWIPIGQRIGNNPDDGKIAPSIHLTGERQLAVGFPTYGSTGLLNLGKVQVYQFP